MNAIQSRIRQDGGAWKLSILCGEICRAYMLLDMLAEGGLSEICFRDAAAACKVLMRRSSGNQTTVAGDCILLSANDIGCAKQLLAQCYLSPYDAQWLHCDIETADGMVLCLGLSGD